MLFEYYNYADVVDKIKADKLLLYHFYNHKIEIIDKVNKNILSKSRIYLILGYKLKQMKKHLEEYLKKEYIIFNYILFASAILFAKKLNDKLRFYVNYRRLNTIIKKNRYFILLINKILINYKIVDIL